MVLLSNLSTFSKVDFKYLGMCDDSTGLFFLILGLRLYKSTLVRSDYK